MTSGNQSPHGELSDDELRRYSRHLLIPEVGVEGQLRLKDARVLVIGAGGLGSPVIQYLGAAGVGTIGIVDFDVVDHSNLQRQILFSTSDIGRSKTDVASECVSALNPDIRVIRHNVRLNGANAVEIFNDYSIIVDGSDNFETRYLVNDVCVLLGKTNIHAAVHRFNGQVSVFVPHQGPCYRCVFSEPPEPGEFLNCAEAGVLGVLPGIVGTIQATECLKAVLSIGNSLVGKLLLIDALEMSFRTIKLSRDSDCISCGEKRVIQSPDDLVARHSNTGNSCSARSQQSSSETSARTQASATATKKLDNAEPMSTEIGPEELQGELQISSAVTLIDVREPHEFSYSHLDRAINIPLGKISDRLPEILTEKKQVVVYCKSGARSQKAVAQLRQAGMTNVRNLSGGLSAWSRQVDASISVL